MNKLKLLELFGGIGACSKALEKLKIDYEVVDYVEIDKYAVKSFNAIHNTNFEPQDICDWDKDIEVDLIMHGSPCQDFSLAGKQAGGDEGSGTRSSLMYETIRIVEKLKPKYVIWENVKNLLSKKHRHNFDAYLEKMNELGYVNYYQVLNAKDYEIPQNRERVFTISILKENPMIIGSLQEHASKRIDGICPTLTSAMGMGGGQTPVIIENTQIFEFPPKQELKLKLKDMLEDEVDEKYYLSENMTKYISTNKLKINTYSPYVNKKHQEFIDENGYVPEMFNPYNKKEIKDIAPTLTAQGDSITKSGTILLKSKCKRLESLVKKTEFEEGKVLNMDLYNQTTNENISQCLTEPHHNSQRLFDGLRIRKLTPKECWRLMGFDDEDFEKAAKVNSKTQLYKQAGNSIVVNVLEAILKELLINE